jgi:antitoxin FitA
LTATAVRLHNAVTPRERSGAMPVLTIRNVPDDLYVKLKASAAERRRSVNSEVIECLRVALANRRPRHVEGFLDRARAVREGLRENGVFMSAAEVDEAKRWGRR